jgi:protein TonB
MTSSGGFESARLRVIIFAGVTVLHIMLILLVAFNIETVVKQPEPVAGVMKLVDLQEEIPPPPPEEPPVPRTDTQEPIAENIIETDEEPPPVTAPINAPVQQYVVPEQVEYMPQHMITQVPVFPEDEIRRNTVYPPIARRSNIEGTVYLALFIDREGNIRDVRVLRENPPDRGFGEAAVNAFNGIRAKPAEANGVPVAVQYRYNISFTLR